MFESHFFPQKHKFSLRETFVGDKRMARSFWTNHKIFNKWKFGFTENTILS